MSLSLNATKSDVYCLAQLILEWFDALPRKLLEDINLESYSANEESALGIGNALDAQVMVFQYQKQISPPPPPPQRLSVLWKWLLSYLLQRILKDRNYNKHTIASIVSCFAGCLIGFKRSSEQRAPLVQTATILYYNLCKMESVDVREKSAIPNFVFPLDPNKNFL